jgi:hypothetical protein
MLHRDAKLFTAVEPRQFAPEDQQQEGITGSQLGAPRWGL